MPPIEVVFYKERSGRVPLRDWLDGITGKAQAKCLARLKRLEEMGSELRRPEADYLQDGIYELRVRLGTVNYRVLYFFHGRTAAVVSHGIVKEKEVPAKEIELALKRKRLFEAKPAAHSEHP